MLMAHKGVYLEVLVFAVCRTVSEFSFYQSVSFLYNYVSFLLCFFFTSYYTVFSINGNFSVSFLVIFQWDSVVFHPFMVIFQWDSVVFHPVMVIFQCTN
jgi:hypothetical protein